MIEKDHKWTLDQILSPLKGEMYVKKNEQQLEELKLKIRKVLETIYVEEDKKYLINNIKNLIHYKPKPIEKNIEIIINEIQKTI